MFKNKKHTGKGHESGKVQSWAVFLELRQKRIVYLICFLEQIIIPILERDVQVWRCIVSNMDLKKQSIRLTMHHFGQSLIKKQIP